MPERIIVKINENDNVAVAMHLAVLGIVVSM